MRPFGFFCAVLLQACCDTPNISSNPDASVSCGAAEIASAAAAPNGGYDRCDNTCRRPGGIICANGTGMDRCPADDGINDCDCYGGTGSWACTHVGVLDGGTGVVRCHTSGECSGGTCVFDIDPTETLGRCSHKH